jgi:hypothetical protein
VQTHAAGDFAASAAKVYRIMPKAEWIGAYHVSGLYRPARLGSNGNGTL